jgi:hypothetical protein
MKKTVAVNEYGYRIGEDHPNAKLTDREVDLMVQMHDDENLGYRKLAQMFEVSKSQVRNICKGIKRCQTATEWKVVHLID